nr:Sir2 family NAD-dependent protein deacetylase [Ahrensia sp. R2A130]
MSGEASHQQLADWVRESSSTVLFTGAGISTESGIDDFRSPGGVWTKMKPIQFDVFVSDEDARLEDWRRRFHFQAQFDAAPLNDGHHACAAILDSPGGEALVTQNIDGLHQRAGVADTDIVEIHGNGTRGECLDCSAPMSLANAKAHIDTTGLSPRCARCGGLVKAAVISFGQPMPTDKVTRAAKLAQHCELFIVLGSSLVVQPAARIPQIAATSGARLVIVNREPTPLDALADLIIRDSIGVAMKPVLHALGRR